MHKPVFMTALVVVLLSSIATAAESIQWAANLDEARTMAVQQNKLLLIHFGTTDCPPCRVVESKVFPTPGVAQTINQYYVALKVDANEEPALVQHFNVQQWPTDVIATVGGDAVQTMVTDQNPNSYIRKLASIAMQNRNLVPSENKDGVQIAQTPRQNNPASANVSTNQFAQAPPPTGQQWSNAVRPPELSSSTARARRPGVTRPGSTPLGGAMGTNRFGNVPAQLNRYGNVAVSSTPGPKAVAAAVPATVNNRFATGDGAPSPETSPQIVLNDGQVQGEIGNPYAVNNVAANSNPQPTQTPTPAAVAPPVSSRQPNSVAANNSRFGNRFSNDPAPAANTSAPTAPQSASPRFSAPANQVAQAPPAVANQQPMSAPNNQFAGNQTAPQVAPSQSTAPTDGPTIGLDGRCPVTLITQSKWRRGDERWGAIHRGHTYLFAGQEEQQKFLSNPDEYSPVLAGMDVVQLADAGRVIQGNRRYGVLYDDDGTGPRPSRIYLFDSVGTRNRFEAAPEEFLQPVMQAMQSGRLDTLLR